AAARRARGVWGPPRAPTTCDADRGAPRLRRSAPSIGGVWGPCRGPHYLRRSSRRATAPPERAEQRGFGGHVGAPMKMDEFEEWFDKGVTDGLPVVPPTRARVEAMLAATHRARDELLGEMPPNYGRVTV